tara:strand:- start:488 stop:2377 length:1890 start_codon:yes stop_codon:yes gene_type:complete
MINPAQYQQVLQKMPDQALMQLLKRPDKIPSQFVVQEINRRKQMRQAGQAQKQQVANAVAMQQQQPVQTTTPEGQPAMGMQVGGSPRYTGSQYDKFKNYSGVSSYGTPRKRNLSPSQIGYKSEYDFDMTDADTGPFGFTPLYDIEAERRRLNTKGRTYPLSGISLNPLKTISRFNPKYKPDGTEIRKADTEEAYKQSQAMQGRSFKEGTDNPSYRTDKTGNPTFSQLGDYGETLEPNLSPDNTGIKSVDSGQTKSENENLVESAKENINKIPESNINNQFSTMLSELDTKLEKTKQPYNRDMLINGYKNSELFDTTAASFKELNDKSQARVEAFNARSDELRKAREKMIGDLEKEGRTKENIVFESLITTGLNLMASPNASFTQALGEAGKAGLATFQSLRKEEKDRVRQKHLMAYQLAEQEFAHKNQADQLESSLDLQKVNFNKTLQEMARQEKKDYIEESKLAKELEQKDDQLNIMADKNALEVTKTKINSLIAMDKLAVEKAGMNSLIQHRQNSTDLENKKLDSNVTVLSYMIQNKTDKETPDDIINKYIASQSNSTELGKAQQDLIRDIGKELAKKVDLERAVSDKEYAASILVTLQDTLETFRDFSFGSGGESNIVDKINKMKN